MLFPNAGVEVNPAFPLLLGFMAGTLSGFFGVGSGFLITGDLLVFGVPPFFAVGTGLTLIIGSSLINTLNHRKVGNVDFKLGALLVIGTIPAVALRQASESSDNGFLGITAATLLLSVAGAMCVLIAAMLVAAKGKSRGPSPAQLGRTVRN